MTRFVLVLLLLSSWAHAHDCPTRGRMGLYAGSFDPPTRGHMAILREAIREMGVVCIMVNTLGPKDYNTSYDERVRMIRAALGADVDKVAFTRSPVGNSPALIDDLARTAQEVHVYRGSDISLPLVDRENVSYTIYERLGQEDARMRGPRVTVKPDLETGMSSTEVRAAILAGDEPRMRRLLDPSVQQIIAENHLYRPAANADQALRNYREAFDAYRRATPRAQRSDFHLPEFKETQSPAEWNGKFERSLNALTAPMNLGECFNAILRVHTPD